MRKSSHQMCSETRCTWVGEADGRGRAESASAGGPAPDMEPLCGEGAGDPEGQTACDEAGACPFPSSTRFMQKVTLCFFSYMSLRGKIVKLLGKMRYNQNEGTFCLFQAI